MGLPENSGLELHAQWPHGKKNLITDVAGVKVGHVTLKGNGMNTGVTAVLPHDGNLFRDKVMAGAEILNGFGKSAGLLQLKELGSIETPIILTNTLSVGTCLTGLTRYMLDRNPDIGVTTGTVNCLVTECNDGGLNDIRGLHVEEKHVEEAIRNAAEDFEEGAVGGGTGMRCMGLKGGIGSASRVIEADGQKYTVGALVMSNYGKYGRLRIGGEFFSERMKLTEESLDKGSIIMLLATDLPLSERQLNRVSKRAALALGRTGSYMGNGSGDIAIAFTTANRIPHYPEQEILSYRTLKDGKMDAVFEAAIEAVEESIISSLYHAETMTGVRGNTVKCLREMYGI